MDERFQTPEFEQAVFTALKETQKNLKRWGVSDTDVRLRIFNDDWYFYTGDSSYDQDHRGYWGASSVTLSDTYDTLRETAKDLIDQVLEDEASNA